MENFTDKQWWFQELESIAKTPDQIRASAVLRNLLQSYKEVSNSKATVVPEDWILVPMEACAEMLEAGDQAYIDKQNDISSPAPTEFPWERGGPIGYAWDAMLKNIPSIYKEEEVHSIKSSSTVEEILASLESLYKKFPKKYAFDDEPIIPLVINGEDWAIQRCNDVDRYYLTNGTPDSIKEATEDLRRAYALYRASLYASLFVPVRANGDLSKVNISG